MRKDIKGTFFQTDLGSGPTLQLQTAEKNMKVLKQQLASAWLTADNPSTAADQTQD